ncbi:MAG: PEP-CTERM sorting domain-containing protein [Luteolibacter sp.]
MKTKTVYSVALLHLALCSAASAALTVYDGFDYGAVSGGDLTGRNGGSGFSGAYTAGTNSTIYTTTGLTYTGLQTTGGASQTADGVLPVVTTINFRGFTAISSGDTWVSFLARRSATAGATTFAGLSFYNSTGIATGDAEFTISSAGTGGTWRLFDNNNGGATTAVSTGITIAADTTYLLVAKIAWGAGVSGTETVSLFVNPTLGSTPVTALASRDINMASNIDKVRIAGTNAVDYTFDEIRIGDSFASVTPVPEASTSTVLLLGLTSLAFRRRRSS